MGCAQTLGIQSLMRDMGWHATVVIHSDATAAVCIAHRKGLGQIRHLDVTDLSIQDKIRSKIIQVTKVLGTENMADAMAAYDDKASLDNAMSRMHMVKTSGRSAKAPKAMGA